MWPTTSTCTPRSAHAQVNLSGDVACGVGQVVHASADAARVSVPLHESRGSRLVLSGCHSMITCLNAVMLATPFRETRRRLMVVPAAPRPLVHDITEAAAVRAECMTDVHV